MTFKQFRDICREMQVPAYQVSDDLTDFGITEDELRAFIKENYGATREEMGDESKTIAT